jgi:hypothetical protein
MKDCFVAQVAPRNDEKRGCLIEKPVIVPCISAKKIATMYGIYFFLFAGYNVRIVKIRMGSE